MNKEASAIVRQIKISLITDTTNPIIDWFNDLWSKLNVIQTDVYHKDGGEFIYYILYNDEKQWIFFQDNKNDKFWCNYKYYWSFFERKHDLNYDYIQDVTKLLVENALNNDVTTPINTVDYRHLMVENALNNDVTRPILMMSLKKIKVGNALNTINI